MSEWWGAKSTADKWDFALGLAICGFILSLCCVVAGLVWGADIIAKVGLTAAVFCVGVGVISYLVESQYKQENNGNTRA
jgi:hypothetical protein